MVSAAVYWLLLTAALTFAHGRNSQTANQAPHSELADQFKQGHRALQHSISDVGAFQGTPKPTEAQQREADVCLGSKYDQLYAQIQSDLAPWKEHGITKQLMDFMYHISLQQPHKNRGAAMLFEAGQAYVLSNTTALMKDASHHARLIVAHLLLFKHLSQRFGPTLPDVEMLFGTADVPAVKHKAFTPEKATEYKQSGHTHFNHKHSGLAKLKAGIDPTYFPSVPLPMIRFCKADMFADILAPDIHFYMRGFGLVNATEKYTREFPWPMKNNSLFGRFSPYARAVDPHSNATMRKGYRGRHICQGDSSGLLYCKTRLHFIHDYVRLYKRRMVPGQMPAMDVAQQPKRSMSYHAAQRWLLHLDGQTCSSRLEQLLALGSLVIKEESGYVAFFHHLLQPYQHYLPMWKDTPADVEQALAWAMDHDPYHNTTGSTYPRTWTEVNINERAQDAKVVPGNSSSEIAAAQSVWSGASAAARIAAAGQALARQYLSKEAVTCYWFKLLHELSKLHRFQPGLRGGQRNYTMPPKHVDTFLSSRLAQKQVKQYFTGKAVLDL